MRTARLTYSALAFVCTLALVSGIGTPTSASAVSDHGTLTWRFTSDRVRVGTPIQVTYTATKVLTHSSLTFEREVGTGNVWKPINTVYLGTVTTTINLPGVPVGAYFYRLLVTTNAHDDYYSVVRRLYSYE
jgi:hypothetical protein